MDKIFAFWRGHGAKLRALRLPWVSVVSLLATGRPTTVPRLVAAVVVDTVQRQPWRTWAKMVDECLERIFPCLAHLYSSATVAVKVVLVWFRAAPFGVMPRPVFASHFSIDAIPMIQRWPLSAFQASAALNMPREKFARNGSRRLATFATACEPPAAKTNRRQPPEDCANEGMKHE